MMDASMADLLTLAKSGDGFGDGKSSWIWIILIFFLVGGGGFGLGNRGTDQITNDFLFSNLNGQINQVQNQLNSIGNGICDSTFALNNSIKDGNYALQSAIESCCCQTQKAILESGYRNDLAIQAQTNALITAGNENTRAILDKLCAAELRELQTANASLQNQLTACATNTAINNALAPVIAQLNQVPKVPIPAFLAQQPYCGSCNC